MRGSKAIRRLCRKRSALLACSLLALAAPEPVQAQDPPPPNEISAVDAYRESIPTASGPKPTGERGRRGTLPPSVADRLSSVPAQEASLLRDVATSAAFGAPRSTLRRDTPSPTFDERSLPSVPVAAEAIGDAFGAGRMLFLGLLLGSIAAAAVAIRIGHARREAR